MRGSTRSAATPPRLRTVSGRDAEPASRANFAGFEVLFEPDDFAGLGAVERELIALRIAALQRDAALHALHLQRARERGAEESLVEAVNCFPHRPLQSRRLQLLLLAAERLTLYPHSVRPHHWTPLRHQGLQTADIMTFAQLVAFVNYQVRVLAGMRVLETAA